MKELQTKIILVKIKRKYIKSCKQGCRRRKTDLDIRWLGVDEHEISNHKPNWGPESEPENTKNCTYNTHLEFKLRFTRKFKKMC